MQSDSILPDTSDRNERVIILVIFWKKKCTRHSVRRCYVGRLLLQFNLLNCVSYRPRPNSKVMTVLDGLLIISLAYSTHEHNGLLYGGAKGGRGQPFLKFGWVDRCAFAPILTMVDAFGLSWL